MSLPFLDAMQPRFARAASASPLAANATPRRMFGICNNLGVLPDLFFPTGTGRPILEEDIALANISLDLIGQATLYLGLAGETEGKGRDADALAYFREAVEFRNLQIVELPKGDFAFTIARQFLFDVFSLHQLEFLQKSANTDIAGIASKGYKEVRYHVRHSSEWLQRLGDGTEESHNRAQNALNELWRFTGEMFAPDDADKRLAEAGVAPDLATIQPKWRAMVSDVIERATLSIPSDAFMLAGRTERPSHRIPRSHVVGDANRRAVAPGGIVVTRTISKAAASRESSPRLAQLDQGSGAAGCRYRGAWNRSRHSCRRRFGSSRRDADLFGVSGNAGDRAGHCAGARG